MGGLKSDREEGKIVRWRRAEVDNDDEEREGCASCSSLGLSSHLFIAIYLSLSSSYFYRIINIYYVCIYIIYVIIYIFHVIISFILLTEARARHRPRRTRRPFPLFNTRVNVYSKTTGSVCRGRCRERARERSHPFVPSRFRDFPWGKRQAIDGARTFAVVYFFFLKKKREKKSITDNFGIRDSHAKATQLPWNYRARIIIVTFRPSTLSTRVIAISIISGPRCDHKLVLSVIVASRLVTDGTREIA